MNVGFCPAICKSLNLPEPVPEYKFHPTRKFRIDFAWPDAKLAVEIEGGIFQYGRHNRAVSMLKDMEKYNLLAEMGWVLLRYQPDKINYSQVHNTLKNCMSQE